MQGQIVKKGWKYVTKHDAWSFVCPGDQAENSTHLIYPRSFSLRGGLCENAPAHLAPEASRRPLWLFNGSSLRDFDVIIRIETLVISSPCEFFNGIARMTSKLRGDSYFFGRVTNYGYLILRSKPYRKTWSLLIKRDINMHKQPFFVQHFCLITSSCSPK